ncbi:MAG: hypothetical protein SW127_23480, partial [Actinomycetota bacterium]|nr:hypothetical protein [Actinomycetota bacterium]
MAVLEAGEADIRGAMTALANRTGLADADGYILDRGSRDYVVDFRPDRAPDGAEFDPGRAFEHHSALLGLGSAADLAVTNARDAINASLNEIGSMTPASTAVNRGAVDSTLAATDNKAIHNGTATPEQRGRYTRVMNLSPEQLAQIRAGKPVDIDPSRLAYIKTVLGAGGGDLAGPAATAAIAAAQQRGKDIESAFRRGGGNADDYSTSRRSVYQVGKSADDIARLSSLGKNMARGSLYLGAGVTA